MADNPFSSIGVSTEATPVVRRNPFSEIGATNAEREANEKADEYKSLHSWEFLRDLGRTLLQGASLGHSDEIIGAIRSKYEGKPYETLRDEERDALKRFHRYFGPGATAAEIGGGLTTPLGPLGKLAEAKTLLGQAAKSIPLGYGVGFASGVGASESADSTELLRAGHEAGKLGALVAPGATAVARAATSAIKKSDMVAQNLANTEKAAQLYVADKLRATGLTEAQIAADLARGRAATEFTAGTAALPETIADVTPTTQRVLRGIKVGGEADNLIEPFLAHRQAGVLDFTKGAEAGGQFERMAEDLRLALKLSKKDLADKLAEISGKRSAEANTLFEAARKNSEPFDLSGTLATHHLQAMDMPDPAQRDVLRRAIAFFDQHGTAGIGSPNVFPVDNVKRFHEAKQALDDLIGRAEIREQGNLRRILTQFKHDLMGDVFKTAEGKPTINAGYREALDKFASKSEMLNAAEMGTGFARGTEQVTDAMFRQMSEAERSMFRYAYHNALMKQMGGKAAGPTTDFTGALRTPNRVDELRTILPPRAGQKKGTPFEEGGNRAMLGELIRREHRMSGTASKVLGNSSTAEKAADAIDIGRMARVLRYVRDSGGAMQAAAGSLSDFLERLSAIKGPRAQYLARKLLSTDHIEQQRFLDEVAKTYGKNVARRITGTMNAWLSHFEASIAGTAARTEGTHRD